MEKLIEDKEDIDIKNKEHANGGCSHCEVKTQIVISEGNNHIYEIDKKTIARIGVATLTYIAAFMVKSASASLSLNICAYFIIGYDVILRALKNIFKGEVFDENFLMSIATIGAFAIGEYPEAVAVMLFYQIGEFFQDYAVSRSKKSIADLMDIRPDYANLKINDEVLMFSPEEVKIDDIIVVKPGERVPLDAIVVKGISSVDTSALTGESLPRNVKPGDEILSGSINVSSLMEAKVIRLYKESTVSKILDLVENASSKKSKSEKFITKFARYYTPAVVVMALILAFIVPIITRDSFSQWIPRALIFLVISCPCALVISIPLSFFGGIGGASRRGILIKGSNYLESLANTEIVVFDKTGTLTKGVFVVHEVKNSNKESSAGITSAQLLEFAAYAENYSNHPISTSLKKAYAKSIDDKRIGSVEEIAGHGVKATIDGKTVYVGNSKLMEIFEIEFDCSDIDGTVVHVAIGGKYAGRIMISDELKDDAIATFKGLNKLGIKKTVILTGDSKSSADSVAKTLGANEVYSELLPGDKVDKIEKLMKELSTKGKLVFVGDGINDAPVLARADTGVAMGGLGSDAAIEAADVVIMTDEPFKIIDAIKISRKTLGIAKHNIIFALSIKAIVMILGAVGLANMWSAVFADVGVTFIAVINSMRAMRYDDK